MTRNEKRAELRAKGLCYDCQQPVVPERCLCADCLGDRCRKMQERRKQDKLYRSVKKVAKAFGVSRRTIDRQQPILEQLNRCQSVEAKRLIIGCSK